MQQIYVIRLRFVCFLVALLIPVISFAKDSPRTGAFDVLTGNGFVNERNTLTVYVIL